MDIVTFDISVGDGFLATAHATKWLEIGAGYFNGLRYGMLRRSFGTWYDDRTEGGLAIGFNLYWEDVKRTPMWGTSTLFDQEFAYEGPDYLDNRDRHWSDIGGTFHLAFLAPRSTSPRSRRSTSWSGSSPCRRSIPRSSVRRWTPPTTTLARDCA
jgi:hypothetical protein